MRSRLLQLLVSLGHWLSAMTAVRLLTANLCMISHGGCVRFAVPLGLAGLAIAVLLLFSVPWLRSLVVGGGWLSLALALYVTVGAWSCKGLCFLPIACSCIWEAQHERHAILAFLATFGYVFLALCPCAQVLTCAIRRVRPEWIFDAQERRLQNFCSFLKDYDVVCMQEVTIFWGLDAIASIIRDAGRAHGLGHFCNSGRWPAFPATYATSGLAVLSRFPITRAKPFHFSTQSWFEWSIVKRGALMVELEGPSGCKLALLNVHTTSGIEVLESGVGRRAEKKRANPSGLNQLIEVLDVFEEFSRSAEHRIFCGDFNLPKDSHAFSILKARAKALGLQDCFPDSPPTFGCVDDPQEVLLTKPADRGLPKVLDHVFSNKKCRSAHVEKLAAPVGSDSGYQQVSDHRAVAVSWQ